MKNEQTNDESSYIRVEGASNVVLSIQALAKLYTKYANLVLETKRLHDKRVEKRKALFKMINSIELDFKKFQDILPKEPEALNAAQPEYVNEENAVQMKVFNEEDKFENLKSEFERIRDELKNIR